MFAAYTTRRLLSHAAHTRNVELATGARAALSLKSTSIAAALHTQPSFLLPPPLPMSHSLSYSSLHSSSSTGAVISPRTSPLPLPLPLTRGFSSAPPTGAAPGEDKAANNRQATQQQQQQQHDHTNDSAHDDIPHSGSSWWARWIHELPMPPRGTAAWYREMALIFIVFGVTGSSSMYFVRPLVKKCIGVDGTLVDGPWSYRLACIGILMPAYSVLLVTFGTIFGRHHYFKRQALKMWGRILPLHKIGIVAKPPPVPRTPPPALTQATTPPTTPKPPTTS